MTRQDWQINIENTTESVAAKYGNEVAASVFRRYDATCFEDLSPVYHAHRRGRVTADADSPPPNLIYD